jgi:uncharacterized protein (TIGR00369 family)
MMVAMSKLSAPGNVPDDFTQAEHAGPFVNHLGLELQEVTGDQVTAVWKAAEHLHQPYGIVHGGVHCSVVETLASTGAAVWAHERSPGAKVVGVNNNTDFFKAVSEGELRSVAHPLHRGRLQQLWQVETFDADDRMIARGQVRLQNLYPQE